MLASGRNAAALARVAPPEEQVVASLAAYGLIFAWPFTQGLFLLDTGNTAAMTTGITVGLVAAGLIELTWWARGWVFHERQRFWKKRDDEDAALQPA